MTVTEALAYIADLQAHPEVQLVNHRKLLKAAAVLAEEVIGLNAECNELLGEIERLKLDA